MKRKKLENGLKELGWWLLRHGGNHDIWTDGERQEPIPRHNDIKKSLLVPFYEKQRKELHHEIFWENI